MPALLLRRATPVRKDDALVRVLEASVETLSAENEILKAATRRRRGAGGAKDREGGRGDRRAQGANAAQDVGGRPWRRIAPEHQPRSPRRRGHCRSLPSDQLYPRHADIRSHGRRVRRGRTG